MITVTKKPQTAIKGDEANLSKWVGVHQPVEFEVQRKDYTVNQIWDEVFDGVNQKVFRILGGAQDFAVGTTFNYICESDTLRAYTLTVARMYTAGSTTYVAFNTDDVYEVNKLVINQAFVNVVRKGHYIETLVYISDKAGEQELQGVLRSKTDVFGKAKVNIQKLLSSALSLENRFDYDVINQAQPIQGGIYSMRCREVYGDVVGKFAFQLPNDTMHYVNGSKQLQEPNNFNFGEFVPTLNDARENKAKFLSVFNRPTYFNGYPFSLSFIYSDNCKDKQLQRVEEDLNINGVKSAQDKTNLFVDERAFVNRLMISQDYPSSIKSVNVWLESGDVTDQNPTIGDGDLAEPETVFDGYLEDTVVRVIDLSAWDAIRNLRDRVARFGKNLF